MTYFTLHLGDCLEVMPTLPADSVDAIVCDPPYGFSFMGKAWDHGVPGVPFWEAALKVAKPGAHLLAFGGTRTHHRLMVAIEDAGWEIRDVCMWLHGQGFPKGKRLDENASRLYQVGDLCQCAANTRNSARTFPLQSVLDRICMVATWGATGHDLSPNGHCDSRKSQDCQDDYRLLSHSYDELLRQAAMRVLAFVQPQEYAQEHSHSDVRVDALEGESLHSLFQVLCSDLPTMLGYLHPSFLPHAEQLPRAYGDGRYHEADLRTLLSSRAGSLDVSRLMNVDTLVLHKPHIYSWVACLPLPILHMLCSKNYDTIIPQMEICGNCNGLINKYAGFNVALKPAWEPIIMARAPLSEPTVAANVLAHGCGGINVDACRIEGEPWKAHDATGLAETKFFTDGPCKVVHKEPHAQGRWPSNLILDEDAASLLGEQSRFFYCAKASRADRDSGLEGMELREAGMMEDDNYPIKTGSGNLRNTMRRNFHPTVKPTALMRYLVRLITPPNGTVLDPFMGSGSTGKAAMLEGFDFIGIDTEADYLEIARRRIEYARAEVT